MINDNTDGTESVETRSGEKDPALLDHGRKQRRALLGAIAGVAGASKLPSQWTRPVVDHAVLPAHAQTTVDAPGSFTTSCEITCQDGFYQLLTSSTFDPTLYTITAENGNYVLCSDEFGGVTLESTSVTTFNSVFPTSNVSTTSFTCSFSTFVEDSICTVQA